MYPVWVYAIAKDEGRFVNRWMDSMSEADGVYVLDTGSTDDTVAQLRGRGAQVTVEEISPWRFDVARNRSLALVPEQPGICVCTDLDEVFHPGWRKALEEQWRPGAGQGRYRYTWSFRPDGGEGVVFWYEKIHARQGYRWVHPVHEVLQWTGEGTPGETVTLAGIQLDHHPDPAKSRAQYLPLLELAAREQPDNDRCAHYLGREYFFHRRWQDAIAALKRHLSLPSALWPDERAASMRYMAQAYANLGEDGLARVWFHRGVAEAPHLREPYCDFARFLYERQEWDGVLYLCRQALAITSRPQSYICQADAWGSLPWDLAAQAYYQTGRIPQALDMARKALEQEPEEPRLIRNVELLAAMAGKG